MALANQFLLENWFFTGGIPIEAGSYNYSGGDVSYTGSNVLQSGGGNPYQPVDGILIPKPDGDTSQSSYLIDKDGKLLLWNAEGGLIENLFKSGKSSKDILDIMKKYREQLFKESDIKKIKDYGCSTIRLAVGWWIFDENPNDYGFKVDPFYNGDNGKEMVRQVKGGLSWIENNLCEWIKKYDMDLILDIHCAPGGSSWGVSYAGLPSVWDPDGKYGDPGQYNWLPPVFYVSKECQDYFYDKIIPNAHAFINRVNSNRQGLISGFEPFNEPGLGLWGRQLTQFLRDQGLKPQVDPYGSSVLQELGTYKDINIAWYKCMEKFMNNNLQSLGCKFIIQVFIAPGYGASGKNNGDNGFNDVLDMINTDILQNSSWPYWLAIDKHWYQAWDIPICNVSCDGTRSDYNPQCSMYSTPSKQTAGGEPGGAAAGGLSECKALCNDDKNKIKKIFNDWLISGNHGTPGKDIGVITNWFENNHPNRLNRDGPPLYKLLYCSEWSVATSPPRGPSLQCDDKELINYFYTKQINYFNKNGIINHYWSYDIPQASDEIKNGWSYKWMIDNGWIVD